MDIRLRSPEPAADRPDRPGAFAALQLIVLDSDFHPTGRVLQIWPCQGTSPTAYELAQVGNGLMLGTDGSLYRVAAGVSVPVGDAADLAAHLADTAGAHADTAISYTRADGSKKNIGAGDDDVGTAINALDDAIAALSGLTTTLKTSVVAAINEVDANADAAAAALVARLPAASAGTGAKLILAEPTGGGTSVVTLEAPVLGASRAITMPDADVDLGNISVALAQAVQASEQLLPMAVLGPWAIDGDGARTNGAGLVGATLTLTEAAGAQCKVASVGGTVFANLGGGPNAGFTSNWQLFQDVPAADDAIYFGASVPFPELALDMGGTVQASTGACFTWEYWDGAAWSALTVAYDGTGATTTGTRSFERDGAISFVPPADWAQRAVDGVTLNWIRCRVSTVANIGVALGVTNGKSHELVTPAGGWVCRQTGTITTVRLSDGAATLHTTADVKFILVNYTTGAHSGQLTFAQDVRCQRWTGLSLAVASGDVLGVVVTQEDGAAEPSGVVLELGFTVS